MHNLLWKFVALAGVAGIGFMVVLQVMESMEVNPNLGSQQATAGQQTTPQSPTGPSERQPPPPLRTKETVALGDPFASRGPGADSVKTQPVPRPTSTDPFDAAAFPPIPAKTAAGDPSTQEAVPAPVEPEAAALEFPQGFPALPAPQPETTAEANTQESELPELPLLIPMKNETEPPNLPAFSEGDSEPSPGPFPAPPAVSPNAEQTAQAEDPFADPVPVAEAKQDETEPITVPFDPYEPLPEQEAETAAAPSEPEAPVLFPPAPPTAPETAESPAPEFPAPAFSEETQAPTLVVPAAEPANNADNSASENLTKQDEPKVAEQPAFPESALDPLDQKTPQGNSLPAKTPILGRATVQIPEGPFATQPPVAPSESEAAPQPELADTESSKSAPESPVPSSARETAADAPLLGAKTLDGLETALPVDQSESALPATTVLEAPNAGPAPSQDQPFGDPLDQLTFPNSAAKSQDPAGMAPDLNPAASEAVAPVETAGPMPDALAPPDQPAPGPSPRPVKSRPEPEVTQTNAEPSAAPMPNATRIDGVGVLGSAVPSGPQQPELKIEKTAPPKAALGQPMIYNILVRNVGSSAAHQVIVEDQIPKGTQLTGTIPRGEMADNRLIWRLGVIQPGEEKKIAVRVIPTQEGQIGSVAKVSFVAEVAARTVVAASKLELEFTGPAKAVVGDPVTFHFKLSNLGTGDASKVYLRNILPEGLNHPDGSDLEYEVGLLKAGEVKEIDLTVNATKAGEFVNKAVITAGNGVQKEATTKVKIIGDRITITRTGPKRRYVGRTATFSNTIANLSDANISPVHVVEVIPAGMDFVEANAGGKFDPQKRTVTWAIPELAPNQNLILKLDLLARQEGPQASEVIAYDPNGTRAVVKSETSVEGYTALRLDVREYAEPVDVGEQIGLRVVATNKGTKATSHVIVKMVIPEELEFVSAKGPVDFKRDGATLTFDPVDSLNAQQELEFDLVLKSIKPGDSRVRLEIASEQMEKPLKREEGIRILPTRP